MSPYRSSAEPLVACRPRRTLLGRLRSWWRRRLVLRGGPWRARHVRCYTCRRSYTLDDVDRPAINWSFQTHRADCYPCARKQWDAGGRRGPAPLPFPPPPRQVYE